jgi:alpha-ketoglutarate-dependent taurine dioxygenase
MTAFVTQHHSGLKGSGTEHSAGVATFARHLVLPVGDRVASFHYVWLRDNCWCSQCRVAQTQERHVWTADIPADIAPRWASLDDDGTLRIRWNDDHDSAYSARWLGTHDYSDRARAERRHEPTLWDASLDSLPTFDYEAVVGSTDGQVAYLSAIRDFGVAIVRNTPSVIGEVERFAETIGHVRETAFERIHNVRHDPAGYSVAHTPAELMPHTDLPSYHWPPSIQLLHFLVNEAAGGESTLIDGWAVLADLREEDPAAFATLARVPVSFQVFSDDEDTYASSPLVQLDVEGRVQGFRFSNHLAQPLDTAFEDVEAFYAAYRTLGQKLRTDRYKVAFKTANGDLLTVHGHRVLHGRLSFDPSSGARHLQDVYMEYDDLMARRRVLLGSHRPLSATEGVV